MTATSIELVPPDQRDRRDAYRRKLRHEHPTPPPPSLGTFAEPGVWLSAEIRSLGWSGQEIARRCAAVGAKWAALDIAVNDTGEANMAAFAEAQQACTNAGIVLGAWGDNPNALSVVNRVRTT